MEVHIRLRALEHSVLVPARFTDAELITSASSADTYPASLAEPASTSTTSLIGLARNSGTGVGPRVSYLKRSVAKNRPDFAGLTFESMRPLRVVVDNADRRG